MTETNLDLSISAFSVMASCASGYQNADGIASGPADAQPCTTDGPYTLSGCVESVCIMPTSTTGYEITTTQLSLAQGFHVTVACSEHYGIPGETPSFEPCLVSGPFTVSGCTLNNPCAVEQDDCFGEEHICENTGPGMHECVCPANRHGTATSVMNGDVQPGCTVCTIQAGCAVPREAECSTELMTELVCEPAGNEPGFYVSGTGTVVACPSGTSTVSL